MNNENKNEYKYQVVILGTLRNSQHYEVSMEVFAERDSEAVNKAILLLPKYKIDIESAHIAKTKKL